MSLARDIARRMLGLQRGQEVAPKVAPAPAVAEEMPRAEPTPAPLPPPEVRPGWRRQCQARNGETGKQCGLLEGHTEMHRDARGPFYVVAVAGQTDFARDRQVAVAMVNRADPFGVERGTKSAAQQQRESRERRGLLKSKNTRLRGEACLENVESRDERRKRECNDERREDVQPAGVREEAPVEQQERDVRLGVPEPGSASLSAGEGLDDLDQLAEEAGAEDGAD